EYQVVEPGQYIERSDPAYTNNWSSIAMSPVGKSKTEFIAKLSGNLQKHRRLVRYRIKADESSGKTFKLPAPADTQLNYGYFVYDGVPAWRGAIEPGSPDAERSHLNEFTGKALQRLPVYHLIGKKSSVESATWTEHYGGNEYKWTGTLVYDGKVYDHI